MKRRKRKQTFLPYLLLFTALVVVAFFTNPNEQAHKSALKLKADTIIGEIAEERYDFIGAGAWELAGNKLLDKFIEKNCTIDNFGLFSITKINWNEKAHTVGIGIFGKTYITNQLRKETIQPVIDDIEKSITESFPLF